MCPLDVRRSVRQVSVGLSVNRQIHRLSYVTTDCAPSMCPEHILHDICHTGLPYHQSWSTVHLGAYYWSKSAFHQEGSPIRVFLFMRRLIFHLKKITLIYNVRVLGVAVVGMVVLMVGVRVLCVVMVGMMVLVVGVRVLEVVFGKIHFRF